MVLDLQAIAVAQRWEIHPATQQMVPGKLRDLLTRRYGYAVDDLPHVDLLEALDDMGQLIPLVTEHKEYVPSQAHCWTAIVRTVALFDRHELPTNHSADGSRT